MLKKRWLSVAVILALFGGMPGAIAAQSPDQQVAAVGHDYFTARFAMSPSTATSTGVHDYDTKLDDVSPAAIAAQLGLDRKMLARLSSIDRAALSPDGNVDYQLLVSQMNDDLLLDGALAQWKHNPDQYVQLASGAIFSLMSRNFAPAATRMHDAIMRETAVPAMLAQAEKDTSTVDAVTKDVAADDAAGSVSFFTDSVPEAFAAVKDPSLQSQLKRANALAARAMGSYAAWIKTIKPSGTYAIGADAYRKRLLYEDALDMSISQYLSYGGKALAQTRSQFIATAKEIDPHASPLAVYLAEAKNYPPPSELLNVATGDLVKLRAFVIARHIVTLAPNAEIKVIETPPFQRAFVTAEEDSPGPLETVATQAYYYVTPPDATWPKDRIAGFMAQFNNYEFPIISAHEVYPGHFTNFSLDRHLDLSLTRQLSVSSEFAEGWAHYNEQNIVDQGWGNGDPHVRLAQLEEALLRECRYVAGVKLHTAGWSIDRTERLFRDQCFQTPAVAIEETMRGTQDPMYGYYTLGKLMILKLREDYKKKLGSAYSLQKFDDAFLAHGDPPIPLVRPLILGSADDGRPL
jgi:uncharacterized protein (DUF885 family)